MGRQGTFIGDVAQQTGLSIHAIRFYEAAGLLPEAARTEAGYRLYSRENVEQLRFIRKAQALGFSLAEIRELLLLSDRNTNACSHVKSLLEEKLKDVQAKRHDLAVMANGLRRALRDCKRQLMRHPPGEGKECPVLVKLGRAG